ncbi:MAG TPA: 6-bladed beta-propeller [Longimicrobium sp.]|nr:6-bladed beta-propeller [Longimicrobium sp.]
MKTQRLACAVLLVVATPLTGWTQAAPTAQFRLQRVLAIGGDNAPESSAFMDVTGVAVSGTGYIYVLDAGDRSVRIFDAAGRFVRRFGRQGGGPGEFQLPVGLWVDTLVGVSDLAQQRMSWFSLDGRHLRTEGTPMLGQTPVLRVRPLRYGRAVGATPNRMGVTTASAQPEGSAYVAVVVLSRGAAPDTLLRIHSGVAAFHPRGTNVPFGTVASHMGWGGAHAVLGDSIVATADGYTGTVRWYRADRTGLTLLRTRQLPSRSRPLNADDLRRIERQIRREGPDLPRRLEISAPPRVSIASQALFSDEGFLWIRNTSEPGHAHVWTVFAPDGEIAYRLSLPMGFDLRHVSRDMLYGVAKTRNGTPVVNVYCLIRPR